MRSFFPLTNPIELSVIISPSCSSTASALVQDLLCCLWPPFLSLGICSLTPTPNWHCRQDGTNFITLLPGLWTYSDFLVSSGSSLYFISQLQPGCFSHFPRASSTFAPPLSKSSSFFKGLRPTFFWESSQLTGPTVSSEFLKHSLIYTHILTVLVVLYCF